MALREQTVERVMAWLAAAPPWAVHWVTGAIATLENFVPPLPADMFVLGGGVLVGVGEIRFATLFFVVWAGNVAGAMAVYGLGRRYGASFFSGRWGRMLLHPAQLVVLQRVYHRYGFPVVFFSRFLPMFRAVVPIFAGVSGIGTLRTLVPVAMASAAWYGGLLYGGMLAGRHWRDVWELLQRLGAGFWVLALIALGAALRWWWTSHPERHR